MQDTFGQASKGSLRRPFADLCRFPDLTPGQSFREWFSVLGPCEVRFCAPVVHPPSKELDLETLRKFRAGWTERNLTSRNKLERLRTFLRFCVDAEWITKNHALKVKAPKVTEPPTIHSLSRLPRQVESGSSQGAGSVASVQRGSGQLRPGSEG